MNEKPKTSETEARRAVASNALLNEAAARRWTPGRLSPLPFMPFLSDIGGRFVYRLGAGPPVDGAGMPKSNRELTPLCI